MEVSLKEQFEIINPQNYDAVQISLASSDQILSWSHGEVKTSETINYRTFKPERDGLFCGKIFGPIHDYECICGKYKRMKHRGITCEKCGVEVIQSKVRRERLGHIKLASPVSHVWFLKGLPSRLGNILNIPLKDLDSVLYFDCYIVLESGNTNIEVGEVIDEQQYRELSETAEDFRAGMGAEAIKELLENINILELSTILREELREVTSEAKRKKIIKRLKVVEAFRDSNLSPCHMVLDVIPVISPELRPLVPLDGGRFATSDLNDLYRRVVHRNNRLKRLIDLNAPDIIVKNEKRMLQEAVDALFDNGRRGRPILGSNKRPLKSLSDALKGKAGRFRQNLLGKRVDYSGRTVIVVGPELKLNQCGLPKKMALELFKPFIFRHLIEHEKAETIKIAKRMVENKEEEIWPALDAVIEEHPILLNRAPTLHRLGIQAFEPILIEGKAIQLHPLVCTAFNADFDGDQMAVHIPLSIEAQMETKVLMMATNNILSPATGKPIMIPTQDMVLGLYWLTRLVKNGKGEGKVFEDISSVLSAYDHGIVELQSKIKVKIEKDFIETTPGRVLLYDSVPDVLPFEYYNKLMKKKDIESLVDQCYRMAGNVSTVQMLDNIKKLGFEHSTRAGFSICMSDMDIPSEKKSILKKAQNEVQEIQEQYEDGIITDGERYNKVIDIWSRVTEEIAEKMIASLAKDRITKTGKIFSNPIFIMADSGARGSTNQSKQLGGMRGLMAKPTGEIIETPITANFREGLNVLQYFISTHGARKGLADTALKTANSGYLTRRLVDVAQDSIIYEIDCGTSDGLDIYSLVENGEIIEMIGERVLGRVAAEDIITPYTNEVLIKQGELIDEDAVEKIENKGIDGIKIRSVLTCMSKNGICAKCYGRDLARGNLVSVGEAVGVIAAQSIGEPGTQLTMRTFHIGGTANRQVEQTSWENKRRGIFKLPTTRLVTNKDGETIVMNRRTEAIICDEIGREIERHEVPVGSKIFVKPDTTIEVGTKIAEWDPFSVPIISDSHGIVKYIDIIQGKTMKAQTDDITGNFREVIQDSVEFDLKPRIVLKHPETGDDLLREDGKVHTGFYLPAKAEMIVHSDEEIFPGDVIAKIPRETAKNKDITGGLPRVAELFEARVPKDPCQISDIDGIVEYGEDMKKKRRIIVRPEVGEPREYLVPKGKHITIFEGDPIKAGETLTDGAMNPHDILRVQGLKQLQKFLVDEVQEVYRLQGVKINDKHIEVITRQMLRKVCITEPGDSMFLIGEAVSRTNFIAVNQKLNEEGLNTAKAEPLLLGITKAALSTDSFISAASFQETTKVLTEASIHAKYDTFKGLKENVIIGRLVPAGTGFLQDYVYTYDAPNIIESENNLKQEDISLDKKSNETILESTSQ